MNPDQPTNPPGNQPEQSETQILDRCVDSIVHATDGYALPHEVREPVALAFAELLAIHASDKSKLEAEVIRMGKELIEHDAEMRSLRATIAEQSAERAKERESFLEATEVITGSKGDQPRVRKSERTDDMTIEQIAEKWVDRLPISEETRREFRADLSQLSAQMRSKNEQKH